MSKTPKLAPVPLRRGKTNPLLTGVVTLHPGIAILRKLIKKLRWDEQGGYPGVYEDGKWSPGSHALGHASSEEMEVLCDLAGVFPDAIKSKGSCEDCEFAKPCERGPFVTFHERGYENPCSPCQRPRMSNFKPRKKNPANRMFWCYQCGNIFKTAKERNDHLAHRNSLKPARCPATGIPAIPGDASKLLRGMR